jgi:hypothetical protein
MTRNEIIQMVKARMDEIDPTEGVTILDPQIDAELDNCAVQLVEMLPPWLSNPKTGVATVDTHNIDHNAIIQCPADFVKVHRMKLSHWTRPIFSARRYADDEIRQEDYEHIRATDRTPWALYIEDTVLECYPGGRTLPTVEEFSYVKRPANAQALDDNMMDMLVWLVAAKVYAVHGEGQFSELASQKLKELIQGKSL